MAMSALEAIVAAKAAGVRMTLDGDGIILETETPPLPADVVALLKAVKPDLLKILAWREAAQAALAADAPEDCGTIRLAYGIRRSRWEIAVDGLRRFVAGGWADRAALLGWTKEELYRVPRRWSQIHICGAALLIGDAKVIAVTEDSIAMETCPGSVLRFYRIGRRRVA
jgi:hypothetical protein